MSRRNCKGHAGAVGAHCFRGRRIASSVVVSANTRRKRDFTPFCQLGRLKGSG